MGAGFHLPGEVAFRIIRAADESTKAAELEREPASPAIRALTSVAAVRGLREDVRLQQVVERVEHLRHAQVLDLLYRADEIDPEIVQHFLPVDLAVGDAVELFFQGGGKIVFDVVLEEALQETDYNAALVFRHKALLVDAHITAILQHLQNGGVSGGPADTELLHAPDERGFRIARRRFGEVLRGIDRLLFEELAFAHRGEAAALFIQVVVVMAFLVEREETVEFDHLASGAQFEVAAAELSGDINGGALQLGRFHLARHRALPDQLLTPPLIAVEALGNIGWGGRRGAGAARG